MRFWMLGFCAVMGCAHVQTSAGNPQQLLDADSAFAKDVAQRGVEAWVEAFAPDGAMMPAGGPRIVGHAAIRTAMAQLGDPRKASPALRIEWWPKLADLSADGTLGYTVGNAVIHGPDGDLKTKYVTIWRRRSDGSWKVALDMGTTGWAVP